MAQRSVMKFYADWCKPCQDFGPVVDEVLASYEEITFRGVNIDEDPATAYEYNVRAVPTVLLLEDNAVVGRINGAVSDDVLKEMIDMTFFDYA